MFIWSAGMTLEYLERTAIRQALKFYHGNKTTTARALGCAINTLNSKLERYEQEDKDADIRAKREQAQRDEFDRRQRGFSAPPGTGLPTHNPNITAAAITNSNAEGLNETAGKSNGVAPGARVEPSAHISAQPPMSMPERKEVQGVLSRPVAQSSKKGRG